MLPASHSPSHPHLSPKHSFSQRSLQRLFFVTSNNTRHCWWWTYILDSLPFLLFSPAHVVQIFYTKLNKNALFCSGLMPNSFWVLLKKKKKKATNTKLRPELYALIPSHAYMHPPPPSSPRPEAKAPRHAQRSAGTDPTTSPPHTHTTTTTSAYFPSRLLLSFNNNLGFEFSETHTVRKCNCTARTAFPLFSNSLLPPEWLDLFPLPLFFSSCWVFFSPSYLMFFRQLQSAQKWRRRTHGETKCVWRILTRCGSPHLNFSPPPILWAYVYVNACVSACGYINTVIPQILV